jgi:hypothetical protein
MQSLSMARRHPRAQSRLLRCVPTCEGFGPFPGRRVRPYSKAHWLILQHWFLAILRHPSFGGARSSRVLLRFDANALPGYTPPTGCSVLCTYGSTSGHSPACSTVEKRGRSARYRQHWLPSSKIIESVDGLLTGLRYDRRDPQVGECVNVELFTVNGHFRRLCQTMPSNRAAQICCDI